MALEVSFAGGKKVNADFKGFNIQTDQSEKDGGEGSAPTPTLLFFASLGTCAGLYALNFCEKRKIDTTQLKLILDFETHPKTHMVKKIVMKLTLPPDFPEKYVSAIIKAMDLCYVKKHLHEPPAFETITQRAE
ncbi:MAG: OsmC family protein [Desulfobacterales bacterium]|jgi:ribosomal protein S12 methylthiotransferase accessory factor